MMENAFFVHNQHGMKMFGWDYHSMVKRVSLRFERLLWVDVRPTSEGIGFGAKSSGAVVDGEVVLGENF